MNFFSIFNDDFKNKIIEFVDFVEQIPNFKFTIELDKERSLKIENVNNEVKIIILKKEKVDK